MSYDVCIEAAGTKVLAYHEDGEYKGHWFALTALGFYDGCYGSCSGCDWRQWAQEDVNWNAPNPEDLARAIDAGIGREILLAKPMTLDEVVNCIKECCVNTDECIKWATEAWSNKE